MRFALCLGMAIGLHAAIIVPAQASTSCTAVNSGAFNLTGTALGASSSSSLSAWDVGDQITLTLASSDGISRVDGMYNGSFAVLKTTTVPATGSTILIYNVTPADLTNGIRVDPENNDSITATCTVAALVPTISGVSPNNGPTGGGTVVSLTGTNLTGATAVNFGANVATSVMVNSGTSVTATSPAGGAGIVDVTVITSSGTSMTSAADQFTYLAPPTVTAVSPNKGPTAGGTIVRITGTNLTGATAVNFGANPATSVTVNSATSITATSPSSSAIVVDVTVVTPGGTSVTNAADQFTYFPPPTVTLITPNNGPIGGGTSVTITGANFIGATAVKFGSTATTFTISSGTQITANSPAGSAGIVDVTVMTPGGTSATSAADQFTYGSSRVWVSSLGNDSNDCSPTAPCLTFAGALASAIPGGEIDVLDPGDFGGLVITKSISIHNDDVGEAGILVSGTDGIVINAGATDVVNLRGLVINGVNASNDGINILQAERVNIENCVIQAMGNGSTGGAGVSVTPSSGSIGVEIQNTTIRNSTAGVIAKPNGGAAVHLAISHSWIDNNSGGGVRADGTGGGPVFVSIADSTVSHNASNGVNAVSGPGKAVVNLTRDIIAQNGLAGIQSNASRGNQAIVNVHASTIENNASALNSVGGGSLNSSGDNLVIGIAGTGFTGPVALQ
jgi:hypothetical protein